jgi:hypothetical protein
MGKLDRMCLNTICLMLYNGKRLKEEMYVLRAGNGILSNIGTVAKFRDIRT